MLENTYVISYFGAILLTAFTYFFADITLFNKLIWWEPLVIGAVVVTAGALVEKIKAPMWLMIFIPFPFGLGFLFYFLNVEVIDWLITYSLTLVYYTILHILISKFLKFHSLIPAWKL